MKRFYQIKDWSIHRKNRKVELSLVRSIHRLVSMMHGECSCKHARLCTGKWPGSTGLLVLIGSGLSTSCSRISSETRMKIKSRSGPCNRNHRLSKGRQAMPVALSCPCSQLLRQWCAHYLGNDVPKVKVGAPVCRHMPSAGYWGPIVLRAGRSPLWHTSPSFTIWAFGDQLRCHMSLGQHLPQQSPQIKPIHC